MNQQILHTIKLKFTSKIGCHYIIFAINISKDIMNVQGIIMWDKISKRNWGNGAID